jgi:hypothetical protein
MQGTADKDYFLTLEGKVTTDEEKAHSLLIRKGQDIPKDIADKYGIGKKASADAERPAKAEAPSKDKSAQPAKNK